MPDLKQDPRYPKYVAELLHKGISRETADRAAAVRMESEDKRARYLARMEEYKRGRF